jgi:hypothetical protein
VIFTALYGSVVLSKVACSLLDNKDRPDCTFWAAGRRGYLPQKSKYKQNKSSLHVWNFKAGKIRRKKYF